MDTAGSNGTQRDAVSGGDVGDALDLPLSVHSHDVARMPVDMNSAYYNMNHKRTGMAIIFNHEYFDYGWPERRDGTNVDRDKLKLTLMNLGFQVMVHDNMKRKEIFKIVEQAAQSDHSDCDCFVLAVLSHGERGIIYSRDTFYKPEALWTPFTADRCPTLAGKPKLFFLQVCQGHKLDGGIVLESRTEVDSGSMGNMPDSSRTEVDGSSMGYNIPIHLDFLIAYATIPGFYSWRNTTNGSWFVQTLCSELQDKGTSVDILTLLTHVNQRVAVDFESYRPDNRRMHQKKQIPCVTTKLRRLLQFTRK